MTGLLQSGYYGMNDQVSIYLERELHLKFSSMIGHMVGICLAMILGKTAAGWFIGKFSRRAVFVFGTLGTVVPLPVIMLHYTPEDIVYLMTASGFLYGTPHGTDATYMVEGFEARIRDSAVGGAYGVGRIGAVVAPAAIGYFAVSGSIGFSFLVVGGVCSLYGLVPALFIKEKLYDLQES